MKKIKLYNCAQIMHIEVYEGETIENKVRRVVENNEPISDGAPIIHTNREEGVIAGYNIRTDRWDTALMAMDAVNKTNIAKSKNAPNTKEDSSAAGSPAGDGANKTVQTDA